MSNASDFCSRLDTKKQSIHGVSTNDVTLTRFLLEAQIRQNGSGELTQLLNQVATAVKGISSHVRRGGLIQLFGAAGETNVQGEQVKKLDQVSNSLMINMLKHSHTTRTMVSEENDDIIKVDAAHRGKYIACFDPLDGSSNIDVLVSIGTIFSVYEYDGDIKDEPSDREALIAGRKLVAAGYGLYGSGTAFVYSTGLGVHEFTLDPAVGDFILTTCGITMPTRGKVYSVNEGNRRNFEKSTNDYIDSVRAKAKPYSLRYVGSMVADIHRTLKEGGVFLYPSSTTSPDGKLRLLYEAAPMAFLVEQAGGLSYTGLTPTLDIVPKHIHQRVPIVLGSAEDVKEYVAILKKAA